MRKENQADQEPGVQYPTSYSYERPFDKLIAQGKNKEEVEPPYNFPLPWREQIRTHQIHIRIEEKAEQGANPPVSLNPERFFKTELTPPYPEPGPSAAKIIGVTLATCLLLLLLGGGFAIYGFDHRYVVSPIDQRKMEMNTKNTFENWAVVNKVTYRNDTFQFAYAGEFHYIDITVQIKDPATNSWVNKICSVDPPGFDWNKMNSCFSKSPVHNL